MTADDSKPWHAPPLPILEEAADRFGKTSASVILSAYRDGYSDGWLTCWKDAQPGAWKTRAETAEARVAELEAQLAAGGAK